MVGVAANVQKLLAKFYETREADREESDVIANSDDHPPTAAGSDHGSCRLVCACARVCVCVLCVRAYACVWGGGTRVNI